MQEDEEIPMLKQLRERLTIEDVEEAVQKEVREKNLARKLGIYLSRKYTGMKLKDIATVYGNIGDTGVSQAYYRVKKARKEDRKLHKTIKRIEKRLNV